MRGFLGYAFLACALLGCADLTVNNVHDAPFIASQQMMKATVKNEGWRSAPASTTRLDIKTPSSPAFTQMATRPTPALARNQQIELDMLPFHLSQFVAVGQCIEVKVCADSANDVNEWFGGEDNNCHTKSFCRN